MLNNKNKIKVSEAYRTSIIAIDSYSIETFIARLYNPYYDQSIPIKSFVQLIKELDVLMDWVGLPMSGMEKRSFIKAFEEKREPVLLGDMNNTPPVGRVATFSIRIQYRGHASWQGTIRWLERGVEEYFRSVLELFWLIDNAMENKSGINNL